MKIRSPEEILADIDATLDQLLENAQVIKKISLNTLFTSEIDALQRTQESLLARLIHMNDFLKTDFPGLKGKKTLNGIEHKIVRYGKLNAEMMQQASERIKRAKKRLQPRVRPHRRKKLELV